VPIDGSENALQAVRHVIDEYQRHHELELHLLNVQPRLSRHVARFVARSDRQGWQHERAQAAMAPAAALLTRTGVPFETHWVSGERADQICRISQQLGVHHIVMGTARKNSITRMLEDSVTSRLLETAPVPVEVIPGAAVSRWERWGLPAGFTGVLGLLVLSID
jgi:nucleotide-binding universal stress UspA family protein